MKPDPRVDAYIEKAQPFARPILAEVRKRMAKAHSGIEETIKWNVPFYLVEGRMLASAAAFKKHVKVGVWVGRKPAFQDVSAVAELRPAKEFAALMAEAIAQSSSAMKAAPVKKTAAKQAPVKKTAAKQALVKKSPAAKKTAAKQAPVKTSPAAKKTAPKGGLAKPAVKTAAKTK